MNELDTIVHTYLHGNVRDLRFLLSTVPNINGFTSDGQTLLTWACEHIAINFVEKLTEKSLVNINKKNLWGFSPLSIACYNGSYEIVKLLLDKNADINTIDKNGNLPLEIAYTYGPVRTIALLVHNGADIYTRCIDISANKYMSSAMRRFRMIIDPPQLGFNFMHKACNDNDTDVINILISKYGNKYVHQPDDENLYPIHYACMNDSIEALDILLQNGANPNVRSNSGFTPIQFACMAKSYNLAEMLIDHGADINVSDKFSRTPLVYSCINNCPDLVNLLIEKGAMIDVPDVDGNTPLMYASMTQNLEAVKILLKANANVNFSSNIGNTSLIYASMIQNSKLVEILLDAKANVNTCNNIGNTPLSLACISHQNLEIIELLLFAGADIDIPNNSGNTPFTIAHTSGNKRLAKILVHANAIVNKLTVQDPDTMYNNKIRPLLEADLDGLINSRFNLYNSIRSSRNIKRKFSYMNIIETCSDQILKVRKKLRTIESSSNSRHNTNTPNTHSEQSPQARKKSRTTNIPLENGYSSVSPKSLTRE